MRCAEDLEKEVSYLVQPLCSRAVVQGKTLLTLVHDVKPVIQQGPMCGLVALSIASQLLNGRPCPPDHLLTCAKEKGYSKQGEMFSTVHLLELAQSELECTGTILNSSTLDVCELLRAISKRTATVVPYDADKNHSPCLARGHKAHWCTLVGFAVLTGSECLVHVQKAPSVHVSLTPTSARHLFCDQLQKVDPNNLYLFARQGKSRHLGLWSYTNLMESNANLMEMGAHRDSSDYVIPREGISNSLCSLLMILKK